MTDIFQSIYLILDHLTEIINSLFGKYTGLSSNIILILSGILLLFWGYRLKKLTLVIIGLVFGISLGIVISDLLNINNNNITLILMIVLGMVFAILNLLFYFFTIIILGILTGCTFGLFLSTIINASTFVSIILVIIFACLGGFLSINVNKIMFIIITSIFGYILLRTGIYSINFLKISRVIEEIFSIIVFLIGLIYQFIDNFYPQTSIENYSENNEKTKS